MNAFTPCIDNEPLVDLIIPTEGALMAKGLKLGGSVCAWCWILADSGLFFTAKIARELGLKGQYRHDQQGMEFDC